ncbi:MAG: hypothetical protein MMC33_008542 [Icmadophila ericetorum]|nr:hypothetical protein [Icmadophila ericetorum]
MRLFQVFDNCRYKNAAFESEHDYLKGHCVHRISIVERADANANSLFVCTEAEGRGLAWDIECSQRWNDLKNAYHIFSYEDMPCTNYILWFERESVQRGERGIDRI